MKKYVRTPKNEIFEIIYPNEDGKGAIYTVTKSFQRPYIKEYKRMKQADTIEELCDEFVDIDNHDYYKISHKDGITFALSKTERFMGNRDIRLPEIGQIMGAIFTDKGLIYVAKINGKGELELL